MFFFFFFYNLNQVQLANEITEILKTLKPCDPKDMNHVMLHGVFDKLSKIMLIDGGYVAVDGQLQDANGEKIKDAAQFVVNKGVIKRSDITKLVESDVNAFNSQFGFEEILAFGLKGFDCASFDLDNTAILKYIYLINGVKKLNNAQITNREGNEKAIKQFDELAEAIEEFALKSLSTVKKCNSRARFSIAVKTKEEELAKYKEYLEKCASFNQINDFPKCDDFEDFDKPFFIVTYSRADFKKVYYILQVLGVNGCHFWYRWHLDEPRYP